MRIALRALAGAAAAAALVLPANAAPGAPGPSGPGALILEAAASAPPVAATADLSGAWRLNADLSDRGPGAPGDDQGGNTGEQGGGRRGGGFGGPGRGGFGGRGGGMRGGGMGGPGGGAMRDPEQMKHMRDLMQAVMAAPPSMTIVQHDGDVSFTDDQGQVTTLKADGKEEKHVFGEETAKTKTKWNNDQLVMEINGGGPKITRTYSIVKGADGAKQLKVETKMEGRGGRARTIARIYEPANP